MMDKTYNLVDHLLARGKRCQEQGRFHDAMQVLGQLAEFRHLPKPVAEETQARLAEVQMKRRKHTRARRHLTAALAHDPSNARYLHLMGAAFATGDGSDLQRAIAHYRSALKLEPDQIECLCECGILEVREGHTEEGLAHLRRAVELAPDDAQVLAKLVKGLRLAGRSDDARTELRAGLFRHPRHPQFRKLWEAYQFKQLRRRQEHERLGRQTTRLNEEGPTLLPFVRPADAPLPEGPKPLVREDGPETVPTPHRLRLHTRPDQTNVQ